MTGSLFEGPPEDGGREARLTDQHRAIRTLMLDGQWRTLSEIATRLHHPPASVSAQLRHLRKRRFGGYTVERRYVRRGLWEYRVLPKLF